MYSKKILSYYYFHYLTPYEMNNFILSFDFSHLTFNTCMHEILILNYIGEKIANITK